MKSDKKIILFGGTFDPIHTGHVQVAEFALNALRAEELFFIPAYRSPHKQRVPTDGCHRVAMIRIAIEGIKGLSVDDCEIRRQHTSYTLNTIYEFRQRYGPDAVLYWLIGADQLADLDKWYQIHTLVQQCRLVIMIRGGYPTPDLSRFKGVFSEEQIQQLTDDMLLTPQITLSSTDIRNCLASDSIPEDALPTAVLEYICCNHLYGFGSEFRD